MAVAIEHTRSAAREGQKPPAGRGQHNASIGALEQLEPDFIFQRLDARGDVRLHRVEFERGLVHAAAARDTLKHPKVSRIHCQPP